MEGTLASEMLVKQKLELSRGTASFIALPAGMWVGDSAQDALAEGKEEANSRDGEAFFIGEYFCSDLFSRS